MCAFQPVHHPQCKELDPVSASACSSGVQWPYPCTDPPQPSTGQCTEDPSADTEISSAVRT